MRPDIDYFLFDLYNNCRFEKPFRIYTIIFSWGTQFTIVFPYDDCLVTIYNEINNNSINIVMFTIQDDPVKRKH